MDLKMTFSDPKIYSRPFSIDVELELVPTPSCSNTSAMRTSKDVKHFVITEEDRKQNRTSTKHYAFICGFN